MFRIHYAPVFQKTYDLLRDIHVARKTFEKSEKYTLGEHLEGTALAILRSIIEAGQTIR